MTSLSLSLFIYIYICMLYITEATCPEGSAAFGKNCFKAYSSRVPCGDYIHSRDWDCSRVHNYCRNGFHLGTWPEYSDWLDSGNIFPGAAFGVTSTKNNNGDFFLTGYTNAGYGWHPNTNCCHTNRYLLCVAPQAGQPASHRHTTLD